MSQNRLGLVGSVWHRLGASVPHLRFGWLGPTMLAAVTSSVVNLAHAADLHVMKTGLGDGQITASGIACGVLGTTASTDCDEPGLPSTATVTLSVTVGSDSRFTSWGGDCASVVVTPPATPSCTIAANVVRRVRANFDRATPIPTLADFTPEGIRTFLDTHPEIDTPAEFVATLPRDFRQNWILMPRSESLQTGIAALPRILLPSADATRVFTLGLTQTHASYPGAHPLAIEYMQWDSGDRNFRFHEIVVVNSTSTIPAQGGTWDDDLDPSTPEVPRFPARVRGVSADDQKCFACHSTRNVINLNAARTGPGDTPGTSGVTPQSIKFKTKPNWDTYDSWGGMLPFNRDRIYQGSVEAAAFRTLLKLWTWQNNDAVRAVIEQLELQPPGVTAGHSIARDVFIGGENDGHIVFGFDPAGVAVTTDPQPSGTLMTNYTAYEFNDRVGAGPSSNVVKDGAFLTLHHSTQPTDDEGRGVELFDRLTQGPNPQRIADEMIPKPPLTSYFATGNVPIDVRPFAIAVADGCLSVSGGPAIGNTQTVTGLTAALSAAIPFFAARNGLTFDQVYDDTRRRAQSLTRRKADIERTTLERDSDIYVYDPSPFDGIPIAPPDRVDGLIRAYGAATAGVPGGTGGADLSLLRLRQEVFRRNPPPGHPDETTMGRIYVDRENDSTDSTSDNTAQVALFRYFLEPLGVSVDKWSMGVRGRSRTYTFADLFGSYSSTISSTLKTSLGVSSASCTTVLSLVDAQVARLPSASDVPAFTDAQRIFNKACIECHGGLGYPPYHTYGSSLILAENETPSPSAPYPGNRRLGRSYQVALSFTSAPVGSDVSNSYLYQRITDDGMLAHPYNPGLPFDVSNPDNPASPDVADERCPNGLMPCEGPPLSKTDIETIRRWILGGRVYSEGDPHFRTVQGVDYDFQSTGEFILLRDEGMELQSRQTAVTTAGPLANAYTGLSACVSVNTAVALRVGPHRVTYQPDIQRNEGGEFVNAPSDNQAQRRLILRIDGNPVTLGNVELKLPKGGRIIATDAPGGLQVNVPGGTSIVVTPGWWQTHRIWYMNIEVQHARAVEGVMGAIAPNNWLPALANGERLGPRPSDPAQRFHDLYRTFADSWRVKGSSSLFDHEPGLSSESFVVKDWPVSLAQGCVAPAQPGAPATTTALMPIPKAVAEGLCQAVVDVARRQNCVQDVMVTGERGFATTYLVTDQLERRLIPVPPVLVSPANHARLGSQHVDFEWRLPQGSEPSAVSYRHCVWKADELYDFNRCIKLADKTVPWIGRYAPLWLAALVLLLLAAVLIVLRYRLKGLLMALLLIVIAVAIWLLVTRSKPIQSLKTSVTKLQPNKVYFWKVVAETNDGMPIESKTYRFEVTQ